MCTLDKADNYYVSTNRYSPARVIVFGLLNGRQFEIHQQHICLVQPNGSVDCIPTETNHYYVEVGTYPNNANGLNTTL